jgi:hypothetical protein
MFRSGTICALHAVALVWLAGTPLLFPGREGSATSPVKWTSPAQIPAASSESVTVHILKRARDKAIVVLTNKTPNPIYLCYDPPKSPGTTTFVMHRVQRESSRTHRFQFYGSTGHLLCDSVIPLSPGQSVKFDVEEIFEGKPGRYRVMVGYWDDERIHRLFQQKWPKLQSLSDMETDTMLEEIRRAGRSAYSEVFSVPFNRH